MSKFSDCRDVVLHSLTRSLIYASDHPCLLLVVPRCVKFSISSRTSRSSVVLLGLCVLYFKILVYPLRNLALHWFSSSAFVSVRGIERLSHLEIQITLLSIIFTVSCVFPNL